MEKNPGSQKFWQRGGGKISWNSILPPPKMRVAPQMLPPKLRDLAPPLLLTLLFLLIRYEAQ